MQKLRATLKLSPKIEDVEYDNRKRHLKLIHTAVDEYESAMELLLTAAKTCSSAYEKLHKAFEQFASDATVRDEVNSTITAMSSSIERITREFIPNFSNTISNEALPPVKLMHELYTKCTKLDKRRSDAMYEYNVYRLDVEKKEQEYMNKNRDLTQSKSYGQDVLKRDNYNDKFNTADIAFKEAHSHFVDEKNRLLEHCLSVVSHSLYDLFNAMASELSNTVQSMENYSNSQLEEDVSVHQEERNYKQVVKKEN